MNTLYKWIAIADRHSKIHLDRMFKALGINSSHHMFIIKICENEGIAQDRLPGIAHIDKSNVTRALRYLEKHGFITRRPKDGDRRAAVLFPTDKGRAAYDGVIAIENAWVETITAGLAEDEKQRLLRDMRRVAETAVREARLGSDPA